MEERSMKFSLLVTGIFLLGLLVLTAILKPSRSPSTELTASQEMTPEVPTVAAVAAVAPALTNRQPMLPPPSRNLAPVPPPSTPGEAVPSVSEEKATQQVLTHCTLKPDSGNDGDTITAGTRSGQYRFSLYFVDVPDLDVESFHQLQAHSTYFGNLSEQDMRTVATEAEAYVTSVLSHRTFDVVTRWERAPEESHQQVITSRGFVFIESKDGAMVNLASLLVERGLATVCQSTEPLPDGTPATEYLQRLQALEKAAMAAKRGAWRFSPAVTMTSAQIRPATYQTR